VKNRVAALDDGASWPALNGRGDVVLSVGAWWAPGGTTAFYHITFRKLPLPCVAFPAGQVGMISSDGRCTQKPTTWRDVHVVSGGPIRDIHAR
jgi:hypothetical protein